MKNFKKIIYIAILITLFSSFIFIENTYAASLDTLEITDMYVGFLRYFSGAGGLIDWNWQEMESHFIAFSTNIPIDTANIARAIVNFTGSTLST